MSDVRDWSVSAGGNTSVSPDGFPEGMAPSGVNDAARELMAAVARTARVRYPFYTATASLSTNVSYSVDRPDISLGAYYQGWTTSFIAPVANTGTASLQWTGLTAYPLKYGGSHLTTSAINANDIIVAAYNARGPTFDILSVIQTPTVAPSPITNSLGSDVALNNTANYFTGPTIAQGTVGTWFVSGTITVTDTAGAAQIYAKLWDGTTVIASAVTRLTTNSDPKTISLSGYIASPAGNLRISARDITSTSGAMSFNTSGNSKDCTITAIRIA